MSRSNAFDFPQGARSEHACRHVSDEQRRGKSKAFDPFLERFPSTMSMEIVRRRGETDLTAGGVAPRSDSFGYPRSSRLASGQICFSRAYSITRTGSSA